MEANRANARGTCTTHLDFNGTYAAEAREEVVVPLGSHDRDRIQLSAIDTKRCDSERLVAPTEATRL